MIVVWLTISTLKQGLLNLLLFPAFTCSTDFSFQLPMYKSRIQRAQRYEFLLPSPFPTVGTF